MCNAPNVQPRLDSILEFCLTFPIVVLLPDFFFKIIFFNKFFLEHNQSVKQFRSRQDQQFVGPDLGPGPNCLQKIIANDKSRRYM